MKKIIAFAAFAAALVATVSCNKEQNVNLTTVKTISLGFEERLTDTKTYVKDPQSGAIWWGFSEVDQIIYVFDDRN